MEGDVRNAFKGEIAISRDLLARVDATGNAAEPGIKIAKFFQF